MYADGASITMSNIDIRNIYGSNGGVFYGLHSTKMVVQSSVFVANQVFQNGGLAYL